MEAYGNKLKSMLKARNMLGKAINHVIKARKKLDEALKKK